MEKKARIVRCFVGTNMSLAHDGLAKIAKSAQLDVTKIEQGEFVVFINSAKDRMKLYAPNNVIAYLKLERGRRIDVQSIPLVLQSFMSSHRIDYDSALKERLETHLARASHPGPIEIARRIKDAGLQAAHR